MDDDRGAAIDYADKNCLKIPQTDTAYQGLRNAFLAGIEYARSEPTAPTFPGSHPAEVWHLITTPGKVLCDNQGRNDGASTFTERVNCPDCLRIRAELHGSAEQMKAVEDAYSSVEDGDAFRIIERVGEDGRPRQVKGQKRDWVGFVFEVHAADFARALSDAHRSREGGGK